MGSIPIGRMQGWPSLVKAWVSSSHREICVGSTPSPCTHFTKGSQRNEFL